MIKAIAIDDGPPALEIIETFLLRFIVETHSTYFLNVYSLIGG